MNNQPSNDTSIIAERLYNALTHYMDIVDLAEYISTGPSLKQMREKLAELKEAASQRNKSPQPLVRYVTDKLEFGHKTYRPA